MATTVDVGVVATVNVENNDRGKPRIVLGFEGSVGAVWTACPEHQQVARRPTVIIALAAAAAAAIRAAFASSARPLAGRLALVGLLISAQRGVLGF